MDYEIERKCVGGEKKGKGSMKESCSDLHETGYAHNSLVGLIEDVPPRKRCSVGTCVLGVLRQEAYNIFHTPLSSSQLGAEEISGGIVSKKRLCSEGKRNKN